MAGEQEEAGTPLAENDSCGQGSDPSGKMQTPRSEVQQLNFAACVTSHCRSLAKPSTGMDLAVNNILTTAWPMHSVVL